MPCMVQHAGTIFSYWQSAGAASAVVAALVMRRADDEVEATRAKVVCAKGVRLPQEWFNHSFFPPRTTSRNHKPWCLACAYRFFATRSSSPFHCLKNLKKSHVHQDWVGCVSCNSCTGQVFVSCLHLMWRKVVSMILHFLFRESSMYSPDKEDICRV